MKLTCSTSVVVFQPPAQRDNEGYIAGIGVILDATNPFTLPASFCLIADNVGLVRFRKNEVVVI